MKQNNNKRISHTVCLLLFANDPVLRFDSPDKQHEFLLFAMTIVKNEKADAIIFRSEGCHGCILKRSVAEPYIYQSDRYTV